MLPPQVFSGVEAFKTINTAIKNTLREILTPVPTEWELSLIAQLSHVPVHKCVKYVLYHRIRDLSSPRENQVFAVGSTNTGGVYEPVVPTSGT